MEFLDFFLFDLPLLILGSATLLTGIILFIYGLYGMTVSGFDKTVRNFCLGFGIALIAFMLSIVYLL